MPEHVEFKIKLSIIEIYLESIRDLIDTDKINLKLRESPSKGVFIEDVTEVYATSEDEIN